MPSNRPTNERTNTGEKQPLAAGIKTFPSQCINTRSLLFYYRRLVLLVVVHASVMHAYCFLHPSL